MSDYRASRHETYVRGYWGYSLRTRFAWLPVITEDLGLVWLRSYLQFRTNTGYDKDSWNWEYHGNTVTPSRMERIITRFFEEER